MPDTGLSAGDSVNSHSWEDRLIKKLIKIIVLEMFQNTMGNPTLRESKKTFLESVIFKESLNDM